MRSIRQITTALKHQRCLSKFARVGEKLDSVLSKNVMEKVTNSYFYKEAKNLFFSGNDSYVGMRLFTAMGLAGAYGFYEGVKHDPWNFTRNSYESKYRSSDPVDTMMGGVASMVTKSIKYGLVAAYPPVGIPSLFVCKGLYKFAINEAASHK